MTAAVLAKREVQKSHAELAEEKLRADALVQRQYELIECLGWVSDVSQSSAGDRRASSLIDKVRRQMVADHRGGPSSSLPVERDKVQIKGLLGHGMVCRTK